MQAERGGVHATTAVVVGAASSTAPAPKDRGWGRPGHVHPLRLYPVGQGAATGPLCAGTGARLPPPPARCRGALFGGCRAFPRPGRAFIQARCCPAASADPCVTRDSVDASQGLVVLRNWCRACLVRSSRKDAEE